MHWMLIFVVEKEGFPAAVLIRSIFPTEGLERIAERRKGRSQEIWTDGPGKICQALAINRVQNGADLCEPQAELFVELGVEIPDECVTIGPRVGLNSVPEPWKSVPWRFLARYEPL
jgi:DNA-3-methyladenine glycosylase